MNDYLRVTEAVGFFLILLLVAGAFLNIGAIKPISTQNTNSIADTKSISHL